MAPELKGKVTLDSTAFARGLKALRRDTAAFARGFKPFGELGANIAKAATVAGVTAAAGLGVAFRAAYKLSDEMEGLGERTGIATDLLSKLAYAGRGAGVAADDIALAYAAFAKSKAGKSGSSFLGELEKLDKVADPIKRAQAAMETFGKSGMSMISLLDGGWSALTDRMAEASRLGVVITPRQAAAVERMGFAWERLKSAMTGLTLRMFSFDSMADNLDKVTDAVLRLGESRAFAAFANGVANLAGNFVQFAERAVAAWRNMSANQREQLTSQLTMATAFVVAWKAGFVAPLVQGLRDLGKLVLTFPKAFIVAFTAINAFLAGLSLGRVLEDSFNVSSYMQTLWAGLKGMLLMWQQWHDGIQEIAARAARSVADVWKNPFNPRTIVTAMDDMQAIVAKRFDAMRHAMKGAKKELADILADRSRDNAARTPDSRSFWERYKAAYKDTLAEMGDLAMPDAMGEYLRQFAALPGSLPDVPAAMGLGPAASMAADMAESFDRINGTMTPLRGKLGQFLRAPPGLEAQKTSEERAAQIAGRTAKAQDESNKILREISGKIGTAGELSALAWGV